MCVVQLAVIDCCDGVCWNMLYFSVRLGRCSRWKALYDRPTFPKIPRIPAPNYDICGAEAQHTPPPPPSPQHPLQTHTCVNTSMHTTHAHIPITALPASSQTRDSKWWRNGGRAWRASERREGHEGYGLEGEIGGNLFARELLKVHSSVIVICLFVFADNLNEWWAWPCPRRSWGSSNRSY